MSVFFPSVSIVIHGSNKCPHSHPRLSPSPSIIQSFILSMASIMGKPLVRTAWLGLGWCCCNEGIFAFKWLLMRWWWYDPPTLPHENWTYELGQLGRLMIKIHRREKQIVVCLLLWLLTCCCWQFMTPAHPHPHVMASQEMRMPMIGGADIMCALNWGI